MNDRNFRRLTPAAFLWKKIWRHTRMGHHDTLFAHYPADVAFFAMDAVKNRPPRSIPCPKRKAA
jgi:hypothetical protein